MKATFRIGRIVGIEVGANWSVAVIAALIVWSLAAEVLPTLEPDQPAAAYWAVGAVAGLLFFVSLLAHELGHAVVARRHGVEVEEITLWLFGGVARLATDSPTARDELRIAAVGPAVSIGLGVVFGFLAWLLGPLAWPGLIAVGFEWLASINLLLGVFNLLPAFPLDGGRVLRAILWGHHGDRTRATLTASRTGQLLAYGMIGSGFVLAWAGAWLSGLWFVFLGWYLYTAARAEAMVITEEDLLAEVRVRDLMTSPVVSVPAALTVAEIVDRYVLGHRHSAYPVVDTDGRLRGLVTLDAVRRVPPPDRGTTSVDTIAHGLDVVAVAGPDDPMGERLVALLGSPTGRMLVVDHERVVGIVTTYDLAHLVAARAAARGLPTAGV